MNAQQLKNSILQEAIEGRLVPQDPNDEPASILLERIREEKRRLVKEGKLKKKDLEEKPIQEDEIPFDIPESWEWVRLSSLSSAIHYGYTASASPTGNSKLLRITDIQNDKVDWKSVPFCSIKEKDLGTYQLKNRDILIARTGGTIGKTYIVRQLEEVAVFASYLIRVIPLQEVNEEFLKLFMMTPCYWTQLIDASSGTGQPNVNGQSLSKLILPIPPKEEQARILAKIEELLPKVEEYGQAQDALDKLNAELPERLKKSILQEAISGRLVPQDPNDEPASILLDKIRAEKAKLVKERKLKKKDLEETPISEDEIPFDIPESWEWCRMSNLSILISGTSYKKDDVCSNGIRILRGGNIQNDRLVLNDDDVFVPIAYKENEKNIKEGDILIVGSTGSHKVIGKPAIVTQTIKDCQIGAFLRIVRPIASLIADYLHIIFISDYYREIIRSHVQGTNIYNVRSEYIEDMLIPLPPLAEQKRIVAKIEQLLGEIDKLK